MLIDRKHRSWGIGTAVALAAASAVYAAYPRLSARAYTGGSWVGLLFGAAAAAAMVFAGLLAVRKAIPLAPVGSAQFWLRGHIWIGLLSGPLALYHASFQLGGPLEMLLMICLAVVFASGVFGLAMQQILPRLLKVRVPLETFAEQIPYLCRRFRAEGDSLIAGYCGKLDVEFEPLRSEAFQFVLAEGRLRNGREQEDFAKYLSTVYTGAPQDGAASRRPGKGTEQVAESRPIMPRDEIAPSRANMPGEAAGSPAKVVVAPRVARDVAPAKASTDAKGISVNDKLALAKAAGKVKKAATTGEPSSAGALEAGVAVEKKMSIADKLAQAKAAGAAKLKADGASESADPAATALAVEAKPAPKAVVARPSAQALLEKLAKKGKTDQAAPPDEKPAPAEGPLPRTEELMAFYLDEVRPFLDEDFRMVRNHPFADETTARMRFANQGRELPDKLLAVQRRLEDLCDARRQFLEQGRIRAWLHYWLLVHAPLSAVLFVLLASHIVMALRVVPWEL